MMMVENQQTNLKHSMYDMMAHEVPVDRCTSFCEIR